MTRFVPASLLLVLLAAVTASAQTTGVSGSVWADLFIGPDGDVVYPQYSFKAKTGIGTLTGYGFLERAPHEPLFTNHVNTFTFPFLPILSVRTEVGGALTDVEGSGTGHFFQAGLQANAHQIVPPLTRVMDYLVVTQLPGMTGIRPPNTLIAGATRHFPLKDISVFAEGYRRFLPGGRPDYGEYWLVVSPKRTKPVSFGVFLLQDGARKNLAFGGRIGS